MPHLVNQNFAAVSILQQGSDIPFTPEDDDIIFRRFLL